MFFSLLPLLFLSYVNAFTLPVQFYIPGTKTREARIAKNNPRPCKNPDHSNPHHRSPYYPEAKYNPDNGGDREFDYEDFPAIPPFLKASSLLTRNAQKPHYRMRNEIEGQDDLYEPHQKRYLGIDIPDYISTGGKSDAIKNMSNKMKAVGKRK